MTELELAAIRTVNYSRRADRIRLLRPLGARWLVIATGQAGWRRVYAGYDLDPRTDPYIMGPSGEGRRKGGAG